MTFKKAVIKRAKDVHRCIKNIGSFTDRQAIVTEWDDEHLKYITVEISPKDGPYTGGKYKFKISFCDEYPKVAPTVDCLTIIYHPNIDPESDVENVCLSLFNEWEETFGLEDTLQGLMFLLKYPNLEDPLSGLFDGSLTSDEEFYTQVQRTLRGGEIDGIDYPRMIADATDDQSNSSTYVQCNNNCNESQNCINCSKASPIDVDIYSEFSYWRQPIVNVDEFKNSENPRTDDISGLRSEAVVPSDTLGVDDSSTIAENTKEPHGEDYNLGATQRCVENYVSDVEKCFAEFSYWRLPADDLEKYDDLLITGDSSGNVKDASSVLTCESDLIECSYNRTTVPIADSTDGEDKCYTAKIEDNVNISSTNEALIQEDKPLNCEPVPCTTDVCDSSQIGEESNTHDITTTTIQMEEWESEEPGVVIVAQPTVSNLGEDGDTGHKDNDEVLAEEKSANITRTNTALDLTLMILNIEDKFLSADVVVDSDEDDSDEGDDDENVQENRPTPQGESDTTIESVENDASQNEEMCSETNTQELENNANDDNCKNSCQAVKESSVFFSLTGRELFIIGLIALGALTVIRLT